MARLDHLLKLGSGLPPIHDTHVNPGTLSQARLQEILHYDPDTGLFTWRTGVGTASEGARAGGSSNGYVSIQVDCKRYYAHRLAFLYMTGAWPTGVVDHRNNNPSDNRWGNLRDATRRQNALNRKTSPKVHGVTWNKDTGRWMTSILGEKAEFEYRPDAVQWLIEREIQLGYFHME